MPRRNNRVEEPNQKTTKRQDISKSWTNVLLKDLQKQSKKKNSKKRNYNKNNSKKRNS